MHDSLAGFFQIRKTIEFWKNVWTALFTCVMFSLAILLGVSCENIQVYLLKDVYVICAFYRVARAGPEIYKEEATWVFKLIHVLEKKTCWFSASSELEMKVLI